MLFKDKAASDVIIIVNSILSLTSIVSVGIRFRRPESSSRSLDFQDVMLFMAALCGTITSILQCVATEYGLGSHTMAVSPSHIVSFLKMYPVIMVFYFACNMFVKFALLIFYLRTTYERVHLWAIWIMIFIAFGFGISNIFVMVFQCIPLDKLWNPAKSGSCIDILPFYYANAWIMIVNDTIMYIMPIVFTWKLSLSRPQRVVLNLLFALGAVVVLTSILRLLALIRYDRAGSDFSYHIASILLWSAIENHTAIFIACTPSIKALVVGTLVPFVTSVNSSIGESIKTFRTSQAATGPRSGVDSRRTTNPFDMQNQMAGQFGNYRTSTRKSFESHSSRFDLTAARIGSTASCEQGLARKDSEISIDKGTYVAAIPLDDLEAQILPPYTYVPKSKERR